MNTTYTNTTGRAIFVCVSGWSTSANKTIEVIIDGISVILKQNAGGNEQGSSFVVPAGSTYKITTNDAIIIGHWAELR